MSQCCYVYPYPYATVVPLWEDKTTTPAAPLTVGPMQVPLSGSWVCAKCGRSYGPYTYECAPCNRAIDKQTGTTTKSVR